MTRAELIQSLRESSRAVRAVAARRDVGAEAEEMLRTVSAGLDELSISVTTDRVMETDPLSGEHCIHCGRHRSPMHVGTCLSPGRAGLFCEWEHFQSEKP